MRRIILYTDSLLHDQQAAKTARCLLRHCPERIKAVLDVGHGETKIGSVCPQLGGADIPVVTSLHAVAEQGDEFVIGFAPIGGRFTPAQREMVDEAASRGLKVINCLHDLLPADDGRFVNLRAFDRSEMFVAKGLAFRSTRILTVGTSHSIGKMTTTVKLHEALRARGADADWIATGQTGMLIRGEGKVIDSIPIDFAPGHIERLVLAADKHEYVVVEGQGSLFHPSYSPSSLALFHAAAPQMLVMCHALGIERFWGFSQKMPTVKEAIRAYALLSEAIGVSSRVVGVALDPTRVSRTEFELERGRLEDELGLPCCDPVGESAGNLAEAVLKAASEARRDEALASEG